VAPLVITLAVALAIVAPSLGVAENYWGPGNCSGKTSVQVMTHAELSALRDVQQSNYNQFFGTSTLTPQADADGDPVSCNERIAYNSFRSRAHFCTAIVHETGHVRDLTFDNPNDPAHSPDKNNIMSAGVKMFAGCMYRFPPSFVKRQSYVPKHRRWNCQPSAKLIVWTCRRKGLMRTYYQNSWDS
jgi:hypothetical protein